MRTRKEYLQPWKAKENEKGAIIRIETFNIFLKVQECLLFVDVQEGELKPEM